MQFIAAPFQVKIFEDSAECVIIIMTTDKTLACRVRTANIRPTLKAITEAKQKERYERWPN
jgi:hypothetical protein